MTRKMVSEQCLSLVGLSDGSMLVVLLCLFPLPELDSSLVAQELMAILHEIGKEWLSDFPLLKCPVDKKELSMFGMKNRRRKMEDRYAICLDLNSLYQLQASDHTHTHTRMHTHAHTHTHCI